MAKMMSLPITIARRALSTPGIISEILGWIAVVQVKVMHPNDEIGRREILEPGRLRPLSRVNKTWFNEAVRFFWEDLCFVGR